MRHTTKKTNTHLLTITDTNITTDSSTQTPIEIALQIDENGMTSLKKLYEFLELEPKNYSRWCKRNIIENPFATENIDYIPFVKRKNDQIQSLHMSINLHPILQSNYP